MHNLPPRRHHYWTPAFSEDLSSLGPWWTPSRQKGESIYKPLWGKQSIHTLPFNPQSNIYMNITIWKQTSIYTTQMYHAAALGRHPTSPSCSLKQNLLAATVVAMKYDQTGVIFLITVQLGNQSPGEINEFIHSLPIQSLWLQSSRIFSVGIDL